MSQMPDVFPGFPRGRFVMDPPTSTTADFLHFRLQPENPSAPSDEMREIPLVCPKISKRQFMKDFPTDLYLESVPFSLSTRIPPQRASGSAIGLRCAPKQWGSSRFLFENSAANGRNFRKDGRDRRPRFSDTRCTTQSVRLADPVPNSKSRKSSRTRRGRLH